jgi:hypothetical protein
VTGKKFGLKRQEKTEDWTKLDNDLYSSPNIIQAITSSNMIGAARVTLMGRREIHTEFWWGNLNERDSFADLDVYLGMVLPGC